MTNKPLSQCCNSEMVKGHYCSKGNTLTKCKNYRCLKCGKPAIPREEKKCCEKCYSNYTEHDYPVHTVYDACVNPNCLCHTAQPKSVK